MRRGKRKIISLEFSSSAPATSHNVCEAGRVGLVLSDRTAGAVDRGALRPDGAGLSRVFGGLGVEYIRGRDGGHPTTRTGSEVKL